MIWTVSRRLRLKFFWNRKCNWTRFAVIWIHFPFPQPYKLANCSGLDCCFGAGEWFFSFDCAWLLKIILDERLCDPFKNVIKSCFVEGVDFQIGDRNNVSQWIRNECREFFKASWWLCPRPLSRFPRWNPDQMSDEKLIQEINDFREEHQMKSGSREVHASHAEISLHHLSSKDKTRRVVRRWKKAKQDKIYEPLEK